MIWFVHLFGLLFSWPLLVISATAHFGVWLITFTVRFWIAVFALPIRMVRSIVS